MSQRRRFWLARTVPVLLMAMLLCSSAQGKVIYVDADAKGGNDGTSWNNAYRYLQDALADARTSVRPVEICIGQGIYKPDRSSDDPNGSGDRRAAFHLLNDVTLKGGFAGVTAADPNVRDVIRFEAILSGDLAGDDSETVDASALLLKRTTLAENSYSVVVSVSTGETAVIDGFTITGGNSIEVPLVRRGKELGETTPGSGGGLSNIQGSPSVLNCTFRMNVAAQGGGLDSWSGSPRIIDCVFQANATREERIYLGDIVVFSYGEGGGIYSYEDSRIVIERCRFSDNLARQGGAVEIAEGDGVLIGCTIIGNHATGSGGGLACWQEGRTEVTGCTFSGNIAGMRGGGIWNYAADLTLTSCLITGSMGGPGWLPSNGVGIHMVRGRTVVANCTLTGNGGPNAYALFSWGSVDTRDSVEIVNSIFWNDSNEIGMVDPAFLTVRYSDVQGGWPGDGNINADPCFVAPGHWDLNGTPDDLNDDTWEDGDYRLLPNSPCIDAGDPGFVAHPNAPDFDFYGSTRFAGAHIDVGADEYLDNPSHP